MSAAGRRHHVQNYGEVQSAADRTWREGEEEEERERGLDVEGDICRGGGVK